MIVHIVIDGDFVSAMGHRVALHLGGEPELRRRCLGSLAQLDNPPDEIRFRRPGAPADTAEPIDAEPEPKAKPPPRKGQRGKS